MKIKKIDDRAKAQPVYDIPDRAADDQADRRSEKMRSQPGQPDRQHHHDDRREHRKDQRIEAGLVEQTEADTAVAGQHEIEEPGHWQAMIAAADLAEKLQHRRLARLVERRGERGNGEPAAEHYSAA